VQEKSDCKEAGIPQGKAASTQHSNMDPQSIPEAYNVEIYFMSSHETEGVWKVGYLEKHAKCP
jgi:hypothetical protein